MAGGPNGAGALGANNRQPVTLPLIVAEVPPTR